MVPWLSVFTSLPVYAIMVANICSDWGLYTLLTNIPTYMKEVLNFDLAEVSSEHTEYQRSALYV